MKQEKKCPYCKTSFIGSSHQKFCSKVCGRNFRKANGISKKGKMIKLNCLVCNKVFFINQTQKNNNRQFCSRKCADRGTERQKKRWDKLGSFICQNCGLEFKKKGK